MRGRYSPRTDHLVFNRHVPDEFPYIDLTVRDAEHASPLANLLDEFVHRAQWGLTAVGMVYRVGCHVQLLHALEVLQLLAADRTLRVSRPWLTGDLPTDAEAAAHVRAIRAVETTQRYLFGQPLPDRRETAVNAIPFARATLAELSPLQFGTFGIFDPSRLYDADGQPVESRSTQRILESHAATYAVEVLRRESGKRAGPWLDRYVAHRHTGVYRTLQDLAAAAEQPQSLDPFALLRLCDWALSCPLTHVYGVPPPPDYLEAAVPYARFAGGLDQLPTVRNAMLRLNAQMTPTARDLVEGVIAAYGDIRPGFIDVPPDRSREIDVALEDVESWRQQRMVALDGDDIFTSFSRLATIAVSQAVQRYLLGLRELPRDGMAFQPTLDGLARMCARCDFPVVEYPDGLEVFLCEPSDQPELDVQFHSTLFGLTAAIRALLAPPSPADPARDHLPFDVPELLEWCGVNSEQVA